MNITAKKCAYCLLLLFFPALQKADLQASHRTYVFVNVNIRKGTLTSGKRKKKKKKGALFLLVRVYIDQEKTIRFLKEWLVNWMANKKKRFEGVDTITPAHLDLVYKEQGVDSFGGQPCADETAIATLAETPTSMLRGTPWLDFTLDLHAKYRLSFVWDDPKASEEFGAKNPFSAWVNVRKGAHVTLTKAFHAARKKSDQKAPEGYAFFWTPPDKQEPIELSPGETLHALSSRSGAFAHLITVRPMPAQKEESDHEIEEESESDQQEEVQAASHGIKEKVTLSLATTAGLAIASWGYLRKKAKKEEK